MSEREEIREVLTDALGEEGCGISCDDAEFFKDEDGWKLMMEGFLEPWSLGETAEEAKARIRELASMRFGLS
jgi:hypothetical protein